MDDPAQRIVYEFGRFSLDPLGRRLLADDDQLPLTPKAFETLLLLVMHHGAVVSKTDLLEAVWAETAVEENNLNQQISTLRRVLGDPVTTQGLIATVPGRGYCFVAPVQRKKVEHWTEIKRSRSRLTIDIWRQRAGREREGRLGRSVALAYIFIILAAAFWPGGGQSGLSTPSVAVLEFRTSSLEDRSLGVGLSDTLRARLGTLEDVRVRPGPIRELPPDAVLAGRQVEADLVLTGSIQRDQDRIRVAIEMVDVSHSRIVWGETFDQASPEMFKLQDSISASVVSALAGRQWSRPGTKL